jgi:hypothetical protein
MRLFRGGFAGRRFAPASTAAGIRRTVLLMVIEFSALLPRKRPSILQRINVCNLKNNIVYNRETWTEPGCEISLTNLELLRRRRAINQSREVTMEKSQSQATGKRQRRRDFLIKAVGGAVAAGTLAKIGLPGLARAAEPVNIGGLYPVTGSFAQIGQGCVNAAKLAVQMVNDDGGIKSLGGAKLNLIISDVQSDTTVTRTETDRLISSYKPAAIHGCFASALTLIASEVAERAKVPLLTGSSSDQLNKGRHYTFTPFSRASQFALAQLQMSKLVSDKPKVAVVFENTAFGTSTSNGFARAGTW